jgi:hypothetical protein
MAGSLSRPIIPLAIEYDHRRGRVVKQFTTAEEAKRWYLAKFKAGKRPRVIAIQLAARDPR